MNIKRTADAFIYLSLVSVTASVFFHSVGTSDLFWQMATGEYIARTGSLPDMDIFSYTVPGQPWVNFEWLSEVLLFGIWKVAGYTGLTGLSFAIGLCIVTFLFLGMRKLSCAPWLSLLLVLIALLASASRFGQLRPELFGFLFFSSTIFLLATNKNEAKQLWLLPLILIVWANFHPSVVFGVIAILLYIGISSILSQRRQWHKKLPFLFICAVAPLLNPLAYKIYTIPVEVAKQDFTMKTVSDWAGPSWLFPEAELSVWLLALLTLVGLFLIYSRRRSMNIPLCAISVFFLPPAFLSSRVVPYAVMVLCFFIAATIDLKGTKPSRTRNVFMAIVCILISIAFGAIGTPYALRFDGGRIVFVLGYPLSIGLNSQDFPIEAADFIEKNDLRGNILNDMAWGGYLIWRLYPGQKVFIDTRTHLYGDEFIKEYSDALFSKESFDNTAKKYKINYVLYDLRQMRQPESPLLFLQNDKRWKKIFISNNSIIYRNSEK